MSKLTSWTVAVALAGLSIGCGNSSSTTDMAVSKDMSAAAPDLSTAAPDLATAAPDMATFTVLNNCNAADYNDQSAAATRTVTFGTAGNTYVAKCLLINAGQSVIFSGAFTNHPLRPGVGATATAGSPNNPIVSTTTGITATFAFPTAGFYPYNCSTHDGGGMNGVVRVK